MATTRPPRATMALPLGGLTGAAVRLRFGGGVLTVQQAPPGMLVSGTFEGGVIHRWTGPGVIELEPMSPARPFVTWRPTYWDVGITGQIPVDLRLETGASRSTIDLTWLRIRRLELRTGASETTLKLPAAGQVGVHVACGLAELKLEIPPSVAARIQSKFALGATKVDESRFPRAAGGWASPGYERAHDRVDIAIEGGLGSATIA